ncbi:cell wall-active antibiotics response protein [Bacillus sp. AGMB 02131]|uniref:Cell wall-active antibiotics response protein n=1 Tax=Peribacillus faecalis TaxID=2772559 RepID=A0A927CSE4_9BACI|nr:cell wall-active antibiotics response protein LiaF [Peribacillus faecalis]MBD3107027.1 cell wall-active antibiotics response protein [Peribacillus faecalis]
MVQKTKSDLFYNFLLFAIVIILIEIAFFNEGFLFSAFISAIFIYYGKKRYHRTIGKLSLFIGGATALLTILNMVTFKFLLLAIFLLLVYRFFQSKKHPAIYKASNANGEQQNAEPEQIHKKPLLFKNTIIGGQSTPNKVYEWNDINIQSGIGEFVVDLSETVLPKGESVICIRNLFGSVHIYVPFELEVEIVHSVAVGNVKIFNNEEPKMFNQNIHYHTSQYDQAEQKLKIVTSTVVGSLEVKRV